ncbi:MAG: hypothetical protein VX012_09030, partial [Planctomycetota bacterium]|nr:hypothetical protein [Planctomycetota bacterium]
GLKMLCSSLLIGVTLGWPLTRLVGCRFVKPIRQTVLDMTVVTAGILVTIWPLRLLSSWSIEQTTLITGVLVSWTCLVGGVICLGTAPDRPGIRGAIILGLFCLIGVGAMLPPTEGMQWWRPIDVMLVITLPENTQMLGMHPEEAIRVLAQTLIAAAGIWMLAIGRGIERAGSGRSVPQRVGSDQSSD